MRFHSVLLSALEFSGKGLSENFPFTKIYVKMVPCAVMWLLWVLSWNLRWPSVEGLGTEGKAWLGTVICSLPAASRVEATQGTMERVGRRKGVTAWSDGKAARPACSKGGDAVLSPWDVPNLVLPGGPCHWTASDLWHCLWRWGAEIADFYGKECTCFTVTSSLVSSCCF